MNKLMEGKVAIVTGGGRGIGKAICFALANHGASVAIMEINQELVNDTAAEIAEVTGQKVIGIKVNVADKDDVKNAVEKTVDTFGKLNVVVNCAGITGALNEEDILDINEELWDRTFAVNLKGTLYVIQAAHDHLVKAGGGSVINIASEVAKDAGWFTPPEYVASKAGVYVMSKRLARNYGKEGIRVNSVAPGSIVTEMTKDMDLGSMNVPLGRLGQPEDVANAVLFLASDLSAYITGACLDVNGGTSMMS